MAAVGAHVYAMLAVDDEQREDLVFRLDTAAKDAQWVAVRSPGPAGHSARLTSKDGKVFAVGIGPDGSSMVAAYHPDSDAWTDLAPMSQVKHLLAVVVANDHLYVVGGLEPRGGALKSVEVRAEQFLLVHVPVDE